MICYLQYGCIFVKMKNVIKFTSLSTFQFDVKCIYIIVK